MRRVLLVLAVVAMLFATGCGTKKVPIAPDVDNPEIEKGDYREMPRIGMDRAIITVKRATRIGALYSGYTSDGKICNYTYDGALMWSSGRGHLSGQDDELAMLFYETMKREGYNVVGDPSVVFDRGDELGSARYRLAANVDDIQANICNEHGIWAGFPLGTTRGEMRLGVEWSVYDARQRRTVMQTDTIGYSNSTEGRSDGFYLLFTEAFEDATVDLANDESFHELAGEPPRRVETPDTISVCLDGRAKGNFAENNGKYLSSVVTVLANNSHGSGFVISGSGYVLTNSHVVGELEEVTLRFQQGYELPGKVIRNNPVRDVALIKCQAKLPALPIADGFPKPAQDVFAVGSPMKLAFDTTVTKGVVSAIRKDSSSGGHLIQADVSILGGNSGGPLFNAHGEVVGVSVSGYLDGMGTSTSINFFIPIQEALGGAGITDSCAERKD
ncbi:S1C family serine protease [Desulfohalovibrio reitneri]|uniref:S1C family serine protease n=1 Tax=Desulfohalovibrio reitneri TaxID=1307759 RepID=UPI0004A73B01|nr:trypsin-like peptidase domain-containing protein [Desulfohalovibrio reitneri]